jgi:hypothetical protein
MFKVGDKVSTRINCNTCEGVVVYLNEKDSYKPCLAVFKDFDGDDFSRWLNHSDLQSVPKFKIGEVWKGRNTKILFTIVSIAPSGSLPVLAVSDVNTNDADCHWFSLNGKYADGSESDYDLVEKV